MSAEPRTQRLAVLIDADNASAAIADGLFAEIAKFGEAIVRRIYGDFSGTRLKAWADVLARHAIQPHQRFAYTKGKNASDIALVIDAMDLLRKGHLDGFCLVSSDSDFTGLAARIREEGLDVFGFGEAKTPDSFRHACRRFIFIENLSENSDDAGRPPSKTLSALKAPTAAVPMILRILGDAAGDDGWCDLGRVGDLISKQYPDFDTRTFGAKSLSDLIRTSGTFDIERPDGKGWRVRRKNKGVSKAGRTASER